MKLPFHQDATPKVFENARFLKKVQTDAEAYLWKRLRNRKLHGRKFRRQHPIDHYIVDFYCHECNLIIEVDGSVHEIDDNPGYDAARTEHLTALGLTVIRFTNDQVQNNPQFVISEITKYLTPAPFSSQEKGRG